MSEIPLFKNVENDGLDCRLFGYICDLEERGGFYDASEVYLAKLAQGFAQVELPVTKMHLNWQGKVQDGVYATEAAAAANFAFHTLDKILSTHGPIHFVCIGNEKSRNRVLIIS